MPVAREATKRHCHQFPGKRQQPHHIRASSAATREMAVRFCPKCGRQRTGPGRFCGGCGHDFGVEGTSDATVTALPPRPPPQSAYQPARENRGRARALWVVVAVIVLLAAGGGTFALVKADDKKQPPQAASNGPSPVISVAPPTQSVTTAAPLAQATSPSPSPTPPPTPTPSVSPSVVGVSPGAGPVPPAVELVLSRYFQGINKRDYAEYQSTHTAPGRAGEPEASFDAGYATTVDSAMTLTALTATGDGDLTATVTFTSHQSPSDSIDQSACNAWGLNLYLVPDGAGYLITSAPSGYAASYTDC